MEEFICEVTENPTLCDLEFLTQKINEEAKAYGSAHPFALFLKDETKSIIAGCNGSIIFGSIYTDQLWVHPEHRQRKLGTYLMEQIHEYGRRRGCTISTVATMSFQAPHFYQRLGYKVDFSRKGYDQGESCLFLSKSL